MVALEDLCGTLVQSRVLGGRRAHSGVRKKPLAKALRSGEKRFNRSHGI